MCVSSLYYSSGSTFWQNIKINQTMKIVVKIVHLIREETKLNDTEH
jgi:hypothetical protein